MNAFLHIFIEIAPLCLLLGTVIYFTEQAWSARERRKRWEVEERTRGPRAGMVDAMRKANQDVRPTNLYTPLMPFDESPLPWKGERWN